MLKSALRNFVIIQSTERFNGLMLFEFLYCFRKVFFKIIKTMNNGRGRDSSNWEIVFCSEQTHRIKLFGLTGQIVYFFFYRQSSTLWKTTILLNLFLVRYSLHMTNVTHIQYSSKWFLLILQNGTITTIQSLL